MGILSLFGVLSPVHIFWTRLITGAEVAGMDPQGQKYYRARPLKGYKRERRWVLYKGTPEPSQVPPEYHGWLHHQTDVFPAPGGESFRREWQKSHQPNLTGTTAAYRPPGHLLQGGQRDAATGDYERWQPPE